MCVATNTVDVRHKGTRHAVYCSCVWPARVGGGWRAQRTVYFARRTSVKEAPRKKGRTDAGLGRVRRERAAGGRRGRRAGWGKGRAHAATGAVGRGRDRAGAKARACRKGRHDRAPQPPQHLRRHARRQGRCACLKHTKTRFLTCTKKRWPANLVFCCSESCAVPVRCSFGFWFGLLSAFAAFVFEVFGAKPKPSDCHPAPHQAREGEVQRRDALLQRVAQFLATQLLGLPRQ